MGAFFWRSLQATSRRLRDSRRGNVLVLTGLALPVLIGSAGMAVDTAQWYLHKREIQLAADMGAMAGAYARAQGRDDFLTTARAQARANINTASLTGDPDAQTTTYVNYSGATRPAVSVTLESRRALPFSSMFDITAPTIRATAMAAAVTSGEHCMIALNRTAPSAVSIGGNALVKLGCGIVSNSSDNASINIFGSAQVDARPLSAVGGIVAGESNLIGDTTLAPYSIEQPDPFADVTANASCFGPNRPYDKNEATLQPGVYTDLFIKGDHVFSPGIYVIDGGSFKLNSNNNISGSGVMFILRNGATIDINGGSSVNFTAMSDTQAAGYGADCAAYGGILFFEDKATAGTTTRTSKINGNATLHLGGAIYLPKQTIQMNGNASPSSECLLMVGDKIDISGNPIIPNSCPSGATRRTFETVVVRLVR